MRFLLSRLLVAIVVGLVASPLRAEAPAAPSDHGLRVFVCGHSFHIFVARYLDPIAKSAKLDRHVTLGNQMIGGSSVTQHWDLPDASNRCKEALRSGKVDVLTLSPNWVIPDPAIGKFAKLALENNPQAKIVVQMSWTAFDGMVPQPAIRTNADRDTKTVEELRPQQEGFAKLIELQVDAINKELERPVVVIAPVGYAVLKLRQAVIDGKADGVKKQSELFRDPLGHGTGPILALCTYVNFATIYGRSPVGLPAFDNFGGTVSPTLHKLLQEIAWDAVSSYAPSGAAK